MCTIDQYATSVKIFVGFILYNFLQHSLQLRDLEDMIFLKEFLRCNK